MSGLLGLAYDSSDDDGALSKSTSALPKSVQAAPDVSIEVWSLQLAQGSGRSNIQQDSSQLQIALANPSSTALTYNVTYDNLARPVEGPINPFKSTHHQAF